MKSDISIRNGIVNETPSVTTVVDAEDRGLVALASAVIRQAVVDYERYKKIYANLKREIHNIYRFLYAKNFEDYCVVVGVDPDVIREGIFHKFGGEKDFDYAKAWNNYLNEAIKLVNEQDDDRMAEVTIYEHIIVDCKDKICKIAIEQDRKKNKKTRKDSV